MNYRPGLEGIVAIQTKLSCVDGKEGKLIFRGHDVRNLALDHEFEEVVYLLWYGKLPNDIELIKFKDKLKKARRLPNKIKELLHILPNDMEMMAVLRTCISGLKSIPDSPPSIDEAIEITAIIPTILAYRHRSLNKLGIIDPNPNLNHVANYLYMLTGDVPNISHVKALNAYFVLTIDHGMNAATFTSRVIASTESDIFSAVTGAIGAMKGPLHGGAPTGVMDMLNDIQSIEHAEDWLRKKLSNGEKLMGFGHRVYKTMDPRSVALREVTASLSSKDEWFELANYVEQKAIELLSEYKPGRHLYSNVEFYAAAVFRAISLPEALYTPTFTSSRVAGWCAHVIEQSQNNRIFRPLSQYIGAK